jgi:hypothetical protein
MQYRAFEASMAASGDSGIMYILSYNQRNGFRI